MARNNVVPLRRPSTQESAAPDRQGDLDLARRARDGDRAGAADLYDRVRGVVDATLVRILGRREEQHDDLAQSALVQVIISLRTYGGQCSLATWVTRVTANVAFNTLRSRKRARAVFSTEEPEDAPASGLHPFVAMRLRSALAALPEDKRETVVLHDMLGHQLGEVAALLGITISAAQSKLVRGRKELRELLADLESGS